MAELARGANTALSGETVRVAVSGVLPGSTDLIVLQLTDARSVRTDADMVFFNQPRSPEGAVEIGDDGQVVVRLDLVPADIETLAVAVACDDSASVSLGQIPDLGVTVTDSAATVVAPAGGLTAERAAVLVELYRRGGAWKTRNVSQGWAAGLAALVSEHGVAVADEPVDNVPAAPASGASGSSGASAASGVAASVTVEDVVRSVPGEGALSLEKKQKLDLRKREVAKVLLTKQAADVRARIIMVIDKTGSIYPQYKNGTIHRVVERMVPVAIQLDDDGRLEPYLYATSYARLPDLTVDQLEAWSAKYLHTTGKRGGINYAKIGGVNQEVPIIAEVLDQVRPQDRTPILVLFFTDGGFSNRASIKKLITHAANFPVFWQFIGLGKAHYGLLEELDDLPGRVVDNAGFFAVDDINDVTDADLYQRLLAEFPDWHRAATAAGILPR